MTTSYQDNTGEAGLRNGTDRHEETAAGAPERIEFTGRGGEYFRIWIVNLLLSILTLGIYSAWAKVRRMRYMYDNTRLAGTSFEYHGNPVAVLKGRIVAVVLFGGYSVAGHFSPTLGLAVFALLVLVFPWLLWKSLQFRMHNSSYRGIRFGFRGTARRAYFVYLVLPLLSLFTAYTLWPFAHQRMKKFQHEETRYGLSRFSFDASVHGFYIAYLIGLAVMIGGLVVIGIAFGGSLFAMFAHRDGSPPSAQMVTTMVIAFFAAYAWMFMLVPVMLTLLQNLIWNHTKLGAHQFKSDMKWSRVAFIAITNVIGVALTLGLFMPFARIRMLKYRLECVSLVPDGSLDAFVAAEQAGVTAAGEGMADLLDFDLAL